MSPDPIAARLSLDHLSDFELRKLERTSDGRPDVRAQFIPPCPVLIIQAMVDADAVVALPLVLAIHRQLTSARREETPLNEAVWKISGPSSARKREARSDPAQTETSAPIDRLPGGQNPDLSLQGF